MRAFYKSEEEWEDSDLIKRARESSAEVVNVRKRRCSVTGWNWFSKNVQLGSKNDEREVDEPKPKTESIADQNNDAVAPQDDAKDAGKLNEERLSQQLEFEIDELFDIHEFLSGKSFGIYQSLFKMCNESGRWKTPQHELVSRTGIENRRTFYKHEEWLINLRLLEKRHLTRWS